MFSSVDMLIGVVTLSALLCLSESARIASTTTTLLPTTEAIGGVQLRDGISRLQRRQFREDLPGQAPRGLPVAGVRLREEVDRSRGDGTAAVEVEEQIEMSGNRTADVSQSWLDSVPADVKPDRIRIPNATHRQRHPRPGESLQQPQQPHPLPTDDQLPAKTNVKLHESLNRQRPVTVERHQQRQLFALPAAHNKTRQQQQQRQQQENQQIIAHRIATVSADGDKKFTAGTTAVTKPTTTLLPQQTYGYSQTTNASWSKEPVNPHDYIAEDIADEAEAAYVIGDVDLLPKTSTKATMKPDPSENDIMDHTPYFLPSVADQQTADGKLGDVFQSAVDQVQARTMDDDYYNDTTLGYDEATNTTIFVNTTTTTTTATTFLEVTSNSSVNDSSKTVPPDDVTDETATINNNNNNNSTLVNDSENTTTSDVTDDYNIEADRTLNVSRPLPSPSTIAKWIPPPIVQFAAELERRDGASTTRTQQQQQQQNWSQHRTNSRYIGAQQKMTRPSNVVGWEDDRNNHGHGGPRSENVNYRQTPAREYRVIHRNGRGHFPVVQPRWRRPPLSMYRSMVIPPPDMPVGFTVPLRATSQAAEMRTVSTPRTQSEETVVVTDEADDQNVSDSQLLQLSTTREQQLDDLTTMSSTTELAASNSSQAFNETAAVEVNSTASGSNGSSDAVLSRADQALRGLQAATTSIIPAIVGFVETLTRKQFSWIDVMLAVCCTIAVFLACVNLAFFIAHVLRNKRGKLTFSNDDLHRSSLTSSSRSPSDGADKKTTKQTTTTTNNPSYPERQLSSSSSSSSPDSSPPPPPPPLSGFSPSVVGCQKQCPREDAETLRIRPIGFKRPLTDWGFTNRLITMSAGEPHVHHLEQQQQPADRAPAAVCRGVIQTSMKSTTSDESSSGVESGEGTDHGSALTLPRRYGAEELDDGMVSGAQVAAATTGSYIYGGVDGLRVNVDDGKDSGCTTHADFIYGKDYVELDTKNCSLSSCRQSTPFDESINRKQRRERAGRKAAKNRSGTMSASGHVTVLNRPWKRLFGGSTGTGNLCGKAQHRSCAAGLDDN